MTTVECEKKILLFENEFQLLYQLFFDGMPPREQRNYYYDTDDRAFQKKNTTIRIREKNGQYLGTVKTHSEDESDCSIEESFRIQNVPESLEYEGTLLTMRGDLLTERFETELKDRVFLVLDRNRYLGKTDYELELEYPPQRYEEAGIVMRLIETILNRHEPLERSASKSSRFFQRLDECCPPKKTKKQIKEGEKENGRI